MATIASMAGSASGARPNPVCRRIPVALITGRKFGVSWSDIHLAIRSANSLGDGILMSAAAAWISTVQERLKRYAITLKEDGRLIGSITLDMACEHDHAQLGFWIGVPYWGKGYATEAAREVVRTGFEVWGLHRIYAQYFGTNLASARVLAKVGFQGEGLMRQHVKHWDQYQDVHLCAILRDEHRHG